MPLFLALLLLSLFSFADIRPEIKAFYISGHAQGTTYHITYYAADSLLSQKQTDSILAKIDSSLSIYKPYSLISKFNRSTSGLVADELLREVVEKSIEIFKKTDGAFDITVQPLVQAWGFGPKRPTSPPDSALIQSLVSCVGSDNIHLQNNRLIKDKPCVGIDVNGIAQGYSVDLLAGFLEKKGIKNYLVELGGEIRIKGQKQPSGEKMAVGIESPGDDVNNPFPIKRIIRPGDGAVTTSGNYRNYYQSGQQKITHLINPKTGYPIQNELISVTVIAEDAITADGYDNALMGMGLKKAMSFIKAQKDMQAYFIYHKADGSVADTASAGFYKLML